MGEKRENVSTAGVVLVCLGYERKCILLTHTYRGRFEEERWVVLCMFLGGEWIDAHVLLQFWFVWVGYGHRIVPGLQTTNSANRLTRTVAGPSLIPATV